MKPGFLVVNNRTLWEPPYGVNFYIQTPASVSKLLYQWMPSQALQIKHKNIWDQESYKMTTAGQRPWLEIHRIRTEGVLSELSVGHITLAVSSHEPNKVLLYVNCMSQLPQESAPMGNSAQDMASIVLSLQVTMGLWPGWGLGVGIDEREPTDPERVCKTGVHLSKWNSSLALDDGLCFFFLVWGKHKARRILKSKIDFTQKQIWRRFKCKQLSERRSSEAPGRKWERKEREKNNI